MNNDKEPRIKQSVSYGVRAVIPGDYAEKLDIEFNDVKWEEDMGSVSRGFDVLRLVADYTFKPIGEVEIPGPLDKPVTLQVFFTREDLKQVSKLKLAYWKEGEWRVFGERNNLKRVPIQHGQIWAGYFEVSITNLTDPPIALGT